MGRPTCFGNECLFSYRKTRSLDPVSTEFHVRITCFCPTVETVRVRVDSLVSSPNRNKGSQAYLKGETSSTNA